MLPHRAAIKNQVASSIPDAIRQSALQNEVPSGLDDDAH
jgi:hypothetical protein